MTDEAARLALEIEQAGEAGNTAKLLDIISSACDRAKIVAALRAQSLGTQGSVATPQQVQEACAQVADRAAEAPREVTPGTMARMIAASIRALIPPPPPALVAQREALADQAFKTIEILESDVRLNREFRDFLAKQLRDALNATPATGGDE